MTDTCSRCGQPCDDAPYTVETDDGQTTVCEDCINQAPARWSTTARHGGERYWRCGDCDRWFDRDGEDTRAIIQRYDWRDSLDGPICEECLREVDLSDVREHPADRGDREYHERLEETR